MTSYTVPPYSSLPRRGPPIDLVLHALQDALAGIVKQSAEKSPALISIAEMNASALACALTRAINPGALASSWAADGDADIAGAHLARRLVNPGAEDGDLRPVSNAEGRALETAVARRFADTACSLAITGDKEDAAHARALWEASATLTGLLEWTANGNKPAAPIKDPRLEVPGALLDDLRTEAGEHSIDAETIVRSAVREIKRRRAAMDILTAKRAEAQETADRRMALLLQADERDDAVRAVLGANDGETTVDTAKRVADNVARLKARDACETCREDRRTAIKERDEARSNHVAARIELEKIEKIVGCDPHTRIVTACVREVVAERDAAIEARAQMQARLVAVERERDAAQEEAKALRVAVANKMSESMLAIIMEGIAKGPTMEWRNGKP